MSGSSSSSRNFFFILMLLTILVIYTIITLVGLPANRLEEYRSSGCNLLLDRDVKKSIPGVDPLPPNCSCSSMIGALLSSDGNDSQPLKKTNSKKSSSHLIVPKNGKTKQDRTLTGQLWEFVDMSDQQLYLYENLLKRDWIINTTNIKQFRDEIAAYRKELNGHYIILHKQNVKVREKVKYVITSKTKKETVITSDFYGRLPKTSPFSSTERIPSCAVIGNSGVLLNSKCGSAIDKNDFVFRCNMAPLEPFKTDAGAKSNLTTMNPSIIWKKFGSLNNVKPFSDALSRYNGLIWIPCLFLPVVFPTSYKALKMYKGKNPKIVCGHPGHFENTAKFWAERSLTTRMSTGFYLITSALQVCDEVNLYGFWPFSTRLHDKMSDVPYHYFDNASAVIATRDHAMNDEFNILLQLHNLGVVHLHAGSCR